MNEIFKFDTDTQEYFLTMPNSEVQVKVPKDFFFYLLEMFNNLSDDSDKLSYLISYGVDNWGGYGDAMYEYYKSKEGEDNA